MKVIGGHASRSLAAKVAGLLNCDLLDVEFKRFPDGEAYTRVNGDIGGEIAIIQSTQSDGDFVHMLQLIDACEGAEITAVIPYSGYARQDKRFHEGEAISARAMAKAIDAKRVFTVNVHNKNVLRFFKCPASDLDATPLLGKHISHITKNPVFIAPDDGALGLAKTAAERYGLEYDYLEKTRINAERVEMKPKKLSVKGRDAVLIDDMVSTGGTIVEATKLLRQQEAREVYVACVHAVLAGNALEKLQNAGVKAVIATDTIEKSVSIVSVAPLIAGALRSQN